MRRPRTMKLVVVTVVGLLLALVNVSPALAQPANDDFDNATVVGALPFTDTIGTADATTAEDDPFCNGNEHSVWYAFTPTANTTIRADTVGSNYDTTLSVYTGSRGALSQGRVRVLPCPGHLRRERQHDLLLHGGERVLWWSRGDAGVQHHRTTGKRRAQRAPLPWRSTPPSPRTRPSPPRHPPIPRTAPLVHPRTRSGSRSPQP